jgi:hypothetical protein
MTLSKENPSTAIPAAMKVLRHFHISQPKLKPVGTSPPEGSNHAAFAQSLKAAAFHGWTSIEMLPPPDGLEGIKQALIFASATY